MSGLTKLVVWLEFADLLIGCEKRFFFIHSFPKEKTVYSMSTRNYNGVTEKRERTQALADAIESIIEDLGPLNLEAIVYFYKKQSRHYVPVSEVLSAVFSDTLNRFDYHTASSDNLVRLVARIDEPVRTPSHDNFVEAFYDLYYRNEFRKQHPELDELPNEWIDRARGKSSK